MDTVLGLAITPSMIGWVMADGAKMGLPTVTGDEVSVPCGAAGTDAADTVAAAVAVAVRVRAELSSRGDRLRGVAVTWNEEAVVAVALLLEALADAGFDHVFPVRYSQAAAALAIPVVAQVGAQRALARGAALALAPETELAGPPLEGAGAGKLAGSSDPRRARSRSHAGALIMLVAGSVVFVASVSAALSLQLGVNREAPRPLPARHATVARVVVPAASPAPAPGPPPAEVPLLPPPPVETAPPGQFPQEEPGEFG
ncbi:hypothetical protein [Mycolicibacter minnesotensis]